jgi:hypothetical protein
MSEETGAPAGGESSSAPVTVVTPAADIGGDLSVSEAARALQAARKPKASPAAASAGPAPTTEGELAQANADPADAPTLSEGPQGTDPAQEPPIERPRSWTKDIDDDWKALPRPMQQKIAAREQERERVIRQSQNEAAEKLKGLTAKEQAAEQARQRYEAELPALVKQLQDIQQAAFAEIRTVDDVQALAANDPFRYLQWQAHQTKLQAVSAENDKARGQQEQTHQTAWARHRQAEDALATELIPELADKVKGPALMKRAVERLGELGFRPDELDRLASGKEKISVFDHRFQQLVFSDLKLSEIQRAKTAVAAKPVPSVQRPGTARPSGNAENIQALTAKLNNSGDLKDAAALLQARRARR